ncbi:MAG: Na+/Ca+ antiporter, CaCA family, inner membrane protein [candidate division WS6 bacterium GW2011_GWC1_33_20]|uniref:Na+/Ca+ antiporter, CaCA family, inner membrane protein n=1 Tax=candidate division WS6 bacterium GW2011_GWC1_33_20 TaxID=1619089 RepID=A0A0F9ZZ29_9BACT|nr:MAG: Na+/Ca+ antiporter, CaCA family, inner membrane protein [candidate division WS6 bacterium GW2011_GWC1_33_20]KKP45743.1 MAG: Na+/Ca+ antiporter, CaCA family, inner membrane protein [candidate division WS6 bacterium GW2011_GWF1_33_233]KKP55186.1 MAG: Na+/Ca+ antiporter, CaCA family, inner membrane protein [candidate division WS6 bacterium GW2011_WS6_33_547]
MRDRLTVGHRPLKPRIIVRVYVPQPSSKLTINMNILVDLTIVFICLFFLIKGSEWVMKGSVALAQRFHISKLVIASTLIALGTGLPTIAVNIFLVIMGKNGMDVAVGNALGTNFVNIGLGLGIPAFMLTIIPKYQVFEKEIPIYLAITALLTSFAFDGVITRVEGIIIMLAYVITLIIIYQYSLREQLREVDNKEVDVDTSTISETITNNLSIKKSLLYLFMGFVVLIVFAIALVSMTGRLSQDFNISEYILGLTIIGIGTSVPMIVTSIKSAKKGYVDIIVGNVFGSTIANIALGIGLTAIFVPLLFNKEAISDIYTFNILNILVIFGLLIEMKLLGKSKSFNWVSGLVIVAFYVIYLLTKIF